MTDEKPRYSPLDGFVAEVVRVWTWPHATRPVELITRHLKGFLYNGPAELVSPSGSRQPIQVVGTPFICRDGSTTIDPRELIFDVTGDVGGMPLGAVEPGYLVVQEPDEARGLLVIERVRAFLAAYDASDISARSTK